MANAQTIMIGFERAAAAGLLRAAIFFQSQLRQRFSQKTNDYQNSSPSKPGEYPALVSGFLRDNILYEPTSVRAIAQEGSVRVGYGANADYGAILELRRKRLGLKHTAEDLLPQLSALAMEGAAQAASGNGPS